MIKYQSLYKNRNFNILYIGTLISSLGDKIYVFILPLFIYEWSKSAITMSIMRAIDFLPNIFLGMLAGVIVDRINRKKMMKWTSLLQALCVTLLTLLIWLDQLAIWNLYLIGFLISTVSYTYNNAKHAIVPQLFEKDRLQDIQSKFTFINTLFSIIGPAIGGILIIWFTYEWVFLFYSISLIILWISVFFLHTNIEPVNSKQSLWFEMKEGFVELFGNKTLLPPTLVIIFLNFASSLIIGIITFYAIDKLNASTKEVAWMFSISAIGGLIGAKCLNQLRKKWARGTIFIGMLRLDMIILFMFFFAQEWWQLAILLAFRSCTNVIINIIFLAIRQETTPNHLLGRVTGTTSMFSKIILPLGLLISGIWAEWLPIPYLFIFSSFIVFILLIYFRKSSFKYIT